MPTSRARQTRLRRPARLQPRSLEDTAVKAIALLLPVAVALSLAACDRPVRTVDKSDPGRASVAPRPAETTPRPDKAAPQPAQPVQSATDAKSDTPATDATLSERV